MSSPSQHYHQHLQSKASAKKDLYHSLKAKEDAKRTRWEKLADWLTNISGSIMFLIANCVIFGLWIIANVSVIPGLKAIDPFPFGFLTMAVSLEAIILSTVVLISQNRASRIADLRQEVDLQINVKTEAEITKLLELMILLLKKNDLVDQDPLLQEMLQPVALDEIEAALEKEIIAQ
jgi:uncharacterized membrane protein